ncbi:MAG TPA: hypothetical protein VGG75_04000 [Trebonia sp.]
MAEDAMAEAVPAPSSPARGRWRALAGAGLFLLVVVGLFEAYLHLSQTFAENSDEANILLMAQDMLHGNLYLSGWHVSDVPFITTELPQMALLVKMFGLSLNTAHIAVAVTYTLVVAVAMLLARGRGPRARGWAAVVRMGLALAILLAPQLGVGVFVSDFSVGHIGIALPVMLTWLVLEYGPKRWWVAAITAVMLAWAETADPLVLVIAIFPLLAVCLARVLSGVTGSIRDSRKTGAKASGDTGGAAAVRAALAARWFELALAAAAGVGYAIAWAGEQLLSAAGGYVQQPVPFQLDAAGQWLAQAEVAGHGLLEMFGADVLPGQQQVQAGALVPGGLDSVLAWTRLLLVALMIWAVCAAVRRFFRRDADLVSQLLLAGIVVNLAAYIPSTLASQTVLNTREIAPVAAFAAVLAGRMLGDRLLAFARRGPRLRIRGWGVRAVAAGLAAVLAWYGFGLWREASVPPAPEPYARLVSYLEHQHLTYGVGGYWQASVITVESGGAVTVRAVSSACLQPYEWESKADWYDSGKHDANFLLISNVTGYFSQYSPSPAPLLILRDWKKPLYDDTGSSRIVNGYPLYQYEARVYSGNLLTMLPRIRTEVMNQPAWLRRELKADKDTAPSGPGACS